MREQFQSDGVRIAAVRSGGVVERRIAQVVARNEVAPGRKQAAAMRPGQQRPANGSCIVASSHSGRSANWPKAHCPRLLHAGSKDSGKIGRLVNLAVDYRCTQHASSIRNP